MTQAQLLQVKQGMVGEGQDARWPDRGEDTCLEMWVTFAWAFLCLTLPTRQALTFATSLWPGQLGDIPATHPSDHLGLAELDLLEFEIAQWLRVPAKSFTAHPAEPVSRCEIQPTLWLCENYAGAFV